MMDVKPFNEKGEKLVQIYDLYHTAQTDIERDALMLAAQKELPKKPRIRVLLTGTDRDAYIRYISKQKECSPTDQSIFKDLAPQVEQYLVSGGAVNFEVQLYRKPGYSRLRTLAVERRIGIKASLIIQDGLNNDKEQVCKFFSDGHASAMLNTLFVPYIKQLLEDPPKQKGYKIETMFDVIQDRKYRSNIRIRFLIPFETMMKDIHVLDSVGEKLAALDQFLKNYSFFY